MLPHFLRFDSKKVDPPRNRSGKRSRGRLRPLVATLALFVIAQAAHAATFSVEPDAGSRMEFVSKAPMETVKGKTRRLTGSVILDPDVLGDSLTVVVEVDMASLDTGNDLRNRHMRDNHLHTDQYPKAILRGGRLDHLSAPSLAPGVAVTGTLAGEMELHGTKRAIEVPFEMKLADGTLHVTSRFEISLADYGIPRPQFLVMRLDDIQRVTVQIEAASR